MTEKKPAKAKAEKKPAKAVEAEVEVIVEAPEEVEVAPKKSKHLATALEVVDLFDELRAMLESTEGGKKQSRPLRWALKALILAKDAAVRHFTHL